MKSIFRTSSQFGSFNYGYISNLIRVPKTLSCGFMFYSRRKKCLLSICSEYLFGIMTAKALDWSKTWIIQIDRDPVLKGLKAQRDTDIVADKQGQRRAK